MILSNRVYIDNIIYKFTLFINLMHLFWGQFDHTRQKLHIQLLIKATAHILISSGMLCKVYWGNNIITTSKDILILILEGLI